MVCSGSVRDMLTYASQKVSSFVLAGGGCVSDRSSASLAAWLAQGLPHDMRDGSFGRDPIYLGDIARQDRLQPGNLCIDLIHDLT